MKRREFIAAIGAAAVWPLDATAQQTDTDAAAFPNRAIKIVVPFPAGGPSDVLARMIGQRMAEDWGQPVLIENRVGANTIIGAQAVQKAPPDGYTLLMAIDSTLTMNQYLYRNLPYDPFNDFVPITLVAKTMMFMFVNAASDIVSLKDLIAKAKAQPGKLNFGAGTITSKLMGHLMNKALGIDTVLISYNGSAEVTQGLLTRSVDFTYDGPSAAMSLIQGGQFRILAKFDNRPFPRLQTSRHFRQLQISLILMNLQFGSALSPQKVPRMPSLISCSAKWQKSLRNLLSRAKPMPPGCSRSRRQARNLPHSFGRKLNGGVRSRSNPVSNTTDQSAGLTAPG